MISSLLSSHQISIICRGRILKCITGTIALVLFTLAPLFGQSSAVRFSGELQVGSDGGAGYSVPLRVPASEKFGMALALSYNSNQGDGHLGRGWSFSTGLPTAITRGRTIFARDGVLRGINFTTDDKFYLDGKRLILVSGSQGAPGSVYRTEVESFDIITAVGDSQIRGFEVARKNGAKLYFGIYSGANDGVYNFAYTGSGASDYAWSIKHVDFADGRSVTLTYNDALSCGTTIEAGEQILTSVTGYALTGIECFNARLLYDQSSNTSGLPANYERFDGFQRYTAGRVEIITKRLDRIAIDANSAVQSVFTYDLNYTTPGTGTSLTLSDITQSTGIAAENAALHISWTPVDPRLAFSSAFDSSNHSIFAPRAFAPESAFSNSLSPLVGDFDGDGCQDILLYDQNTHNLCVASRQKGVPTVYKQMGAVPVMSGEKFNGMYVGDFNGDGISDLVFAVVSGSNPGWYVVYGGPNGFSSRQLVSAEYTNNLYQSKVWAGMATVLDLDGDGCDDLIIGVQQQQISITLYTDQGDFNGVPGSLAVSESTKMVTDTTAPVIYVHTKVQGGSVSFTEHQTNCPIAGTGACTFEKIDLNGDGRDDLLAVLATSELDDANQGAITIRKDCYALINTGNDNFQVVPVTPNVSNSGLTETFYDYTDPYTYAKAFRGNHMLRGDVNGDGLDDLIFLDYLISREDGTVTGGWTVGLSKGDGTFDFSSYSGIPAQVSIGETPANTFNQRKGQITTDHDYDHDRDVLTSFDGLGVCGVCLFDLNHDGRKDFLWYTAQSGWRCFLAGKHGFKTDAPVDVALSNAPVGEGTYDSTAGTDPFHYEFYTCDLDGDGSEDLLLTNNAIGLSTTPTAQLATDFRDSLGARTALTYSTTSDPLVYVAGAPVSYPIQESRHPRFVTSELFKDNGGNFDAGEREHYVYQYSGARTDLSGRGFLGFHSFVTLDKQTNVFKYQFLTQSFPMTGLITREQTYRYWEAGGGVNFRLISSHDNTVVFDEVSNGSGSSWGTVYPYISQAVESRWEDSDTPHFTPIPLIQNSQPETLFPSTRPAGAHITITAQSWFDDQPISQAPQTTIPGTYVASDANSFGANTPSGTPNYSDFDSLSFPTKITYGNLRQLKTDYGDGFTETVNTTYISPSGAMTGLVDTVTGSVTSTGYGSESEPSKTYTYWNRGGSITPLIATEAITTGDSKLDVTTTYTRDGYGRITNAHLAGYSSPGDPQHIGSYDTSSVDSGSFEDRYDEPKTPKDAYGHVTTTTYHSILDLPISVTDVNNAQTTSIYDSFGRTTQTRDELKSLQTNTAYSLTSDSGADWLQTQVVSGPSGASGLTLSSTYAIHATATVKPAQTVYYDHLGREIRTIKDGFAGQKTYIDTVYNSLGQLVAKSNPYPSSGSPVWTKTTYDLLGRVKSVTNPNGTVSTTTYNGRTTQVSVAATDRDPQINTTYVDAKGRTIKVWNADNVPSSTDPITGSTTTASIEYGLDGFGRMRETKLKGQTQTITATYDGLSHQISLNDPDKGNWNYVNNALGEVVQQTDANSNVTQSSFDRLGRQLTRVIVEANNGPVETASWFYYDAAGNVATYPHLVSASNKGWIGAPQRDEVSSSGAPGYVTTSTTNVHYYDDKGRPSLDLSNIDGKWFYTTTDYDAYSRASKTTHFWRPAAHESPNDAPYAWQDFGISQTYDSQSYLLSVTDSRNNTWWQADATQGYDYADRAVYFQKGSGHWTRRTYQPEDGTLTNIVTGSGSIQNLAFHYDGLGNLSSRSDVQRNFAETFGYDSVNRLISSTLTGGISYFDNGNIRNKSSVTGQTTADYTYDTNKPHAVATAFGYSMSYDPNGNLQSRTGNGHTWTTRWNGFDKPRWLAQDGKGNEFVYNANHSRVVELDFDQISGNTPTHYTRKRLYADGPDVEIEYRNSSTSGATWQYDKVRLYISGPDGTAGTMEYSPSAPPAQAWTGLVYHTDHLGSIESITPLGSEGATYSSDSSGLPGRYSYDAWGQRRSADTWTNAPSTTANGGRDDLTPKGFTGHEMLDAIGLVHMNGRIYDPLIGRMLSADIVVQSPASLQSYNRYSYVNNNPLILVDPTGFVSTPQELAIEGGAGLLIVGSTVAVMASTPEGRAALSDTWNSSVAAASQTSGIVQKAKVAALMATVKVTLWYKGASEHKTDANAVSASAVGDNGQIANTKSNLDESVVKPATGTASPVPTMPKVDEGFDRGTPGITQTETPEMDQSNITTTTGTPVPEVTIPLSTEVTKTTRIAAGVGQEAHRQIQQGLAGLGFAKEVTMTLKDGTVVRKDAVSGNTVVIIKPDSPSGQTAAEKRTKLMEENGKKTVVIYYDPTDPRYKKDSPTYIGPGK